MSSNVNIEERCKILYNPKLKEDFCNSVPTNESQLKHFLSLFGTAYKHEALLNKDLCEFSITDFSELFSVWTTYKEKSNKKTYLRRYIEWCITQKIVPADELNVYWDFMDQYFNTNTVTNVYFYSEEDLVNRIQRIMSHMHITYYARAIVIYWLIFHRVEYVDIFSLTKDVVDLENRKINIVRTSGYKNMPIKDDWRQEILTIPECMVDLFEHAMYDRSFLSVDGRIFRYPNSNMLIGPYASDASLNDKATVHMVNKFSKQIQAYNEFDEVINSNPKLKDLTPRKQMLYRSGVFCDIFKDVGDNITANSVVKHVPVELHKTEVSHYMKDYEIWLQNRSWILSE